MNPIPAIIESLRREPWQANRLNVSDFFSDARTFCKDSIHVTRTGKVYARSGRVLRIRTSLADRIRLARAYRQQHQVQLQAAWQKAITLPADSGKAKELLDILRKGEDAELRPIPSDQHITNTMIQQAIHNAAAKAANRRANPWGGYANPLTAIPTIPPTNPASPTNPPTK